MNFFKLKMKMILLLASTSMILVVGCINLPNSRTELSTQRSLASDMESDRTSRNRFSFAAPRSGNEGGGGGSVIKCEGSSVYELTDLYEARRRDPGLAPKLAELRRLRADDARNYVSRELIKFLALTNPAAGAEYEKVRDLLGAAYENVVFGLPGDPQDSGPLDLESSCREQRVAVKGGFHVFENSIDEKFSQKHMQVVQGPWEKMTPFDRYSLLLHEIFYTLTEGRVSVASMDPLMPRQKNSADIRRVIGLILTGKAAELNIAPPQGPFLDCWAGTSAVRRDRSQWDRIHFNLYKLDRAISLITITHSWGVPSFISNSAAVNLDASMLVMRGSDLTVANPEAGVITGRAQITEPDFHKDLRKMRPVDVSVSFRIGDISAGGYAAPTLYMKVETQKEVLLDGPISCSRPQRSEATPAGDIEWAFSTGGRI